MKKLILLSGCWLAFVAVFPADVISGKVVMVIDGKTIDVQTADQVVYRVLLKDIDSPEMDQEYGSAAKSELADLVLHKAVSLEILGKNRHGIRIGVITHGVKTDPRVRLLEKGLAWAAEQNTNAEFREMMEKARLKGKGLWKEQDPTPPWAFRRKQSMLQPKSQ